MEDYPQRMIITQLDREHFSTLLKHLAWRTAGQKKERERKPNATHQLRSKCLHKVNTV